MRRQATGSRVPGWGMSWGLQPLKLYSTAVTLPNPAMCVESNFTTRRVKFTTEPFVRYTCALLIIKALFLPCFVREPQAATARGTGYTSVGPVLILLCLLRRLRFGSILRKKIPTTKSLKLGHLKPPSSPNEIDTHGKHQGHSGYALHTLWVPHHGTYDVISHKNPAGVAALAGFARELCLEFRA